MILLATDCLIFRTATGETVPYSSESISVELMGEKAAMFDPEFIKHAAAAVFHYFRDELDRETVSVGEFTLALEKILRGFALSVKPPQAADTAPRVVESDLRLLAAPDEGGELFFFPRLRDELRSQLRHSPQMLCFQNVRSCVKQLVGARRWSERCQSLQDQIVEFLRTCMCVDNHGINCAVVVK
jgi:hypothetical protein